MNKPKRELNPQVTTGDKIMCLHMDGETGVPPMTTGTVRSVVKDPFESDGEIINVNWDNGSTLGLITVTDSWVKVPDEQIKESKSDTLSSEYNFFADNPEIFENFDWRFLREYLYKLRASGVVNMFQASPFLYSGKNWIDRYYGENQEDNEPFQELLEMSDEAKDKMVQGLVKYMESKNMDLDNMSRVNNQLSRLAIKIVQLYMTFA
jgi:hypothetical protein